MSLLSKLSKTLKIQRFVKWEKTYNINNKISHEIPHSLFCLETDQDTKLKIFNKMKIFTNTNIQSFVRVCVKNKKTLMLTHLCQALRAASFLIIYDRICFLKSFFLYKVNIE